MKKTNLIKKVMMCSVVGMTIVGGVATLPQGKVMANSTISPDTREGSLTINKKDSKGDPLGDTEFKIYKVVSLTPGANVGDYAKYQIMPDYAADMDGISIDELGNLPMSKIEELASTLAGTAKSKTPAGTATTADVTGQARFENLELGYYLIVESKPADGYVASKPFLVAIPASDNYANPSNPATQWDYDIEVSPKNEMISIDKDVNNEGSKDTVTIGDVVSFTLDTTMPSYTDDYFEGDNTVTFKISDTMSDGLEIQNSVDHPIKVIVDGNEITAGAATYTVTAANKTGTDADLVINFANEFIKNNRGKSIKVTYSAKVTADAVLGDAGNKNSVNIEYNNKPGETTTSNNGDSETFVYTYGIDVEKFAKVDGTDTALAGAEFQLYKGDLNTAVGAAIATDVNGKIVIKGVDEGVYWLKETKSPSGYTLLANPIKIEIIAQRDANDKVIDGSFTVKVDGDAISEGSTIFTTRYNNTTGVTTVAVKNQKGFTIPSTGGMGITLFITIGALGMIIGVFYIVRKGKKVSE